MIRYHTPGPGNDIYYNYNQSENYARLTYYSTQYVPWIYVDGANTGGNYGTWRTTIRNRMGISSPVIINLSGDYDAASRSGRLDIQIIAIDSITYSNLKLRIAITESNIYYQADNGTLYHNQTFRDLVPGSSGTSITLRRGDVLHYSQNFSCPSPLVSTNCWIAAFIQTDASSHTVLQAAKINVMNLRYNIDPFALISPVNQETLSTLNPSFVWNQTTDPDSAYAVRYLVYLSQDLLFSNPILSDTLTDTTWTCPVPLTNDNFFYWKVVALNGHAPDLPSQDINKFRIHLREYLLSEFGLISPENGDTLIGCNPVCLWHPSTDPDSGYAIRYIINIDSSPNFEFPLADSTSDSTWTCPNCLFNGLYYWRVIARNDHAPDRVSSDIFTFTVYEISGCVYVPGDINGNGSANGIDVGFGVNYLKGISIPPIDCSPNCPNQPSPFFAAGDVNGNCVFNGIDVTFFVRYLKGQVPAVLYCPDCPPAQARIQIGNRNQE